MPKPCSEDWNKMTPTEKGAYCGKCALEVIDFTHKTPEEIRETLYANVGKRTCGHIGKMQLETVNSDYHVWENQSVVVFKSKFLYACLMLFGMTLFTGCDFMDWSTPDVGEIEQVDVGMMEPDTDVVDGGMMIDDSDSTSCNGMETDVNGGLEIIEGEMIVDEEDTDIIEQED